MTIERCCLPGSCRETHNKGGRMANVAIDLKGLRCPQPILKIAAKSVEMNSGDILVVEADCPTFEKDVKAWCDKVGKPLLFINQEGETFRCQIQF